MNHRFARRRTHLAWREDGHNQIRLQPELAGRIAYLHVRAILVSRQHRLPWAGLDAQEEEAAAVRVTYGGSACV